VALIRIKSRAPYFWSLELFRLGPWNQPWLRAVGKINEELIELGVVL
jgi:hypothetical protein